MIPSVQPGGLYQNVSTSPFRLENRDAYQIWRSAKLAGYPEKASDLLVSVADPRKLTAGEHASLLERCRKANMAIYQASAGFGSDKDLPRRLGQQFGLEHLDSNLLADEDAITSIQVVAEKSGRGYIPYTSRRLLWHTDGYYNPPDQQVRAFILHCVHPAPDGGENALLDPELAYIQLRDENPDFIQALMATDAMTIPANDEIGGVRAAQTGPVFSIDPATGCLHMRYTARTRSIQWKDDNVTREAVRVLDRLLNGDNPYVIRHRLQAGQGLLCNNVLHNRTAFAEAADSDSTRLIFRARYTDRIRGTEMDDMNGAV